MTYADLLRFEGACGLALGVFMVVLGALAGPEPVELAVWAAGVVALTLAVRAWKGPYPRLRTDRALRELEPARSLASPTVLRARVAGETLLWVSVVVGFVIGLDASASILATGAWTVWWGAMNLGPSASLVRHERPDALVAHRPPFGAPRLTTTA